MGFLVTQESLKFRILVFKTPDLYNLGIIYIHNDIAYIMISYNGQTFLQGNTN